MASACQNRPTASQASESMEDFFLVFCIDTQRFAAPIKPVDRVIRAIAEAYLPNAPAIVSGLINLRGSVVPVISMRLRVGLPKRPLQSSDCMIIAHTSQRTIALAVDAIEGLLHVDSENLARGSNILPGVPHLEGIAKHEDGLIVIYDLERFLSLDEERALDNALSEVPP